MNTLCFAQKSNGCCVILYQINHVTVTVPLLTQWCIRPPPSFSTSLNHPFIYSVIQLAIFSPIHSISQLFFAFILSFNHSVFIWFYLLGISIGSAVFLSNESRFSSSNHRWLLEVCTIWGKYCDLSLLES